MDETIDVERAVRCVEEAWEFMTVAERVMEQAEEFIPDGAFYKITLRYLGDDGLFRYGEAWDDMRELIRREAEAAGCEDMEFFEGLDAANPYDFGQYVKTILQVALALLEAEAARAVKH